MKRLSTFLLLLLSVSYSVDTMCSRSQRRKRRHAEQVATREEEARLEAKLDEQYQQLREERKEKRAQEMMRDLLLEVADEVVALQEDVHGVDGRVEDGFSGSVNPFANVNPTRSYLQAAKVSTQRRHSMDNTAAAAGAEQTRRASFSGAYNEADLESFREIAFDRELARVDGRLEAHPVAQRHNLMDDHYLQDELLLEALQQYHRDHQAEIDRVLTAELEQLDRHVLNKKTRNNGVDVQAFLAGVVLLSAWKGKPFLVARDVETEDENINPDDEFVLRSPVEDNLDEDDFAMLIAMMEESGEL